MISQQYLFIFFRKKLLKIYSVNFNVNIRDRFYIYHVNQMVTCIEFILLEIELDTYKPL